MGFLLDLSNSVTFSPNAAIILEPSPEIATPPFTSSPILHCSQAKDERGSLGFSVSKR